MIQGSDEWLLSRVGKVTASRIVDVMATTKKGTEAMARLHYRNELMCERIGGQSQENFSSAAMRWGNETEPQARAAYEFYSGNDVDQVGLIDHPTILKTGASPDGLIEREGLVEIKCPNTTTHFGTLLKGDIDPAYIDQMQWQMECTNRKWCDFVSFDPRLPEAYQMVVKRVDRDNVRIKEITEGVTALIDQVDSEIAELRAKYEPQAEAA